MSDTQHTIRVTLVIKAESMQEAEEFLTKKLQLNEWYTEDLVCLHDKRTVAPYPSGSLLFYRITPVAPNCM